MNTNQSQILPRLPAAYRLLSEDPLRCDLGYCGHSTLAAILWMLVITHDGDGWWMINQAENLTGSHYSEAEIQDILDQFEGDDPALHLWRRDSKGNYRLLI